MKRFLLPLLLALSTAAVVSAGTADAQVTGTPLFIGYTQTQTSAAGATTEDGYYLDSRIFETNPGDIDSSPLPTLTYPGPVSPDQYAPPSSPSGTVFNDGTSYIPTLANLEFIYPHGEYTSTYTGTYGGSNTVDWTTDDFSTDLPLFSSGTYNALQNLNVADSVTFNFNSFTGAVSGPGDSAYVFLNVYNASTGADLFSENFEPTTVTSYTMSGGTLAPGTEYYADLDFSNRTNGGDAIDSTVGFDDSTLLYFTTAAAPEESTLISLGLLLAAGLGWLLIPRRKGASRTA